MGANLPRRHGDTLVVAGLWVRPMAESARRAGWRVVALDLFGDRDTRRASTGWQPIGDGAAMAVDGVRLEAALRDAARDPAVFGWVAGSGFEAEPALLDTAADVLPRFGTARGDVARLRDPAQFFAELDRLGLAHPPVGRVAPAGAFDWLVKQAGGSGGWHVRPADPGEAVAAPAYVQRRQPGAPMSALFLADGERAVIVGLNRQRVQASGDTPFAYRGAIGPVVDPALRRAAQGALAALVPAFRLRGLASLDFIAHEGRIHLLEINPRPSASMVLYDDALPRGLMHAHVAASVRPLPPSIAPRQPHGLRGSEIVYAGRALTVTRGLSDHLAALPRCHDLPSPGARIGAGEPLCSVSVQAHDEAGIEAALALARSRVGETSRS